MMGGSQAKKEIADYNQDVEGVCNYCYEADSTADHVRWACKHFDPIRKEIDAELAAIPYAYLPHCIRCGIAPAMKKDGMKTFWGTEVGEEVTAKAKKILGIDLELHTPGDNAEQKGGEASST